MGEGDFRKSGPQDFFRSSFSFFGGRLLKTHPSFPREDPIKVEDSRRSPCRVRSQKIPGINHRRQQRFDTNFRERKQEPKFDPNQEQKHLLITPSAFSCDGWIGGERVISPTAIEGGFFSKRKGAFFSFPFFVFLFRGGEGGKKEDKYLSSCVRGRQAKAKATVLPPSSSLLCAVATSSSSSSYAPADPLPPVRTRGNKKGVGGREESGKIRCGREFAKFFIILCRLSFKRSCNHNSGWEDQSKS